MVKTRYCSVGPGRRYIPDAPLNKPGRSKNGIPGICLLAVSATLLLGACSTAEKKSEPKGPFDLIEMLKSKFGDRPYVILDDKRFVSGPYGDKNDVMRIIETVKNNSTPVHLSNRAVNLPNKPPNLSLTVYSYAMPSECGGHNFHVYEGDDLQILQYDYEEGIKPVFIRDYTLGPTQFVSAGLWGPYDHTDATALEMCILPGSGDKDGGGLMEGNYEIGWITTITDWKQAELGNEYASAVKMASRCLQGQTPAVADWQHQYHVRPGDSLSGISQRVYGNRSDWKKLYEANRDIIGRNPNTLPEGLILSIP